MSELDSELIICGHYFLVRFIDNLMADANSHAWGRIHIGKQIIELELKYNTQLDAAKIKADADLNKLLLSNEYKSFEAAQQSTNQLQQDIESIDAGQKQTPPGNK